MAEIAEPGFDVAIVGAGPAGLTLANLLGLRGLSVLIVERNATTVQEPRAVSIDDESLRTLQAAGLIDEVLTQVVQGYGSRYMTAGGACFLTVTPKGRPFGYPRRNAFRQPVLERQLSDGLMRFEKVKMLLRTTATCVTQDANGVELTIDEDGNERRVRVSYLVGCDGAASTIRKILGFKLEGTTFEERWLIVDLIDSPADRDTIVFCDVDRPTIALPGPDASRRFEFKLFENESADEVLQADNILRLLSLRGAASGSRIIRQTVYTFHARIVNHWGTGRVFLAGDAAHLTPPFAGQGMNSGIRDVHNLAWKLADVVQGRFDVGLLKTYEVERRAHVSSMIDLALRMGRIMGPSSRLRAWLGQTAFRIAGLWPILRAYFGEMKYKPSPYFRSGFLLPSRHFLVGRLLPQPTVRMSDGTQLLLDDAMPKGFVLLGLDVDPDAVTAVVERLRTHRVSIASMSLDLFPTAATPSSKRQLSVLDAPDSMLSASSSLLLVRPDRYVMAAFSASQHSAAAANIARLFEQYAPPNVNRDLGHPNRKVDFDTFHDSVIPPSTPDLTEESHTPQSNRG